MKDADIKLFIELTAKQVGHEIAEKIGIKLDACREKNCAPLKERLDTHEGQHKTLTAVFAILSSLIIAIFGIVAYVADMLYKGFNVFKP